MRIAIFGGTFDPIHRGHLAVARAAQRKFQLDRIYFVPAGAPPHKRGQRLTALAHRYAMVALATAGEASFVPSLAEAEAAEPSSSVDTLRRFRQGLGRRDRLYFLIGIDAFREIAKWREPAGVLRLAETIVVSRPGFSLADVVRSLPAELRGKAKAVRAGGEIALPGGRVHLLPGVRRPVAGTEIRAAAARGDELARLVPTAVAEYIEKMHLYRTGGAARGLRAGLREVR